MSSRIGFIGAGNMSGSLIGGLLARGQSSATLYASDANPEQRQRMAERYGIQVFADNAALVQQVDILVLAVKPQVLQQVCRALAGVVPPSTLVVSVAAGVTCDSVRRWLGVESVVRAMPNTPALIGQGATGLFAVAAVDGAGRAAAQSVFEAVGEVLWVDSESALEAVTAVSGSGPAYFFLLVEAMTAAGAKLGLSPDTARRLSVQTACGAGAMLRESGEAPDELRRRVTSPQGTTHAAITYFQAQGFEALVEGALSAAAGRAAELALELDDDNGSAS